MPSIAPPIAEAPTRNLEAHDLVLRARDFLTGRVTDRGSFEKVVVLFTRAIELDAAWFASPAYEAERACGPAARVAVVRSQRPDASVQLPIGVVPS